MHFRLKSYKVFSYLKPTYSATAYMGEQSEESNIKENFVKEVHKFHLLGVLKEAIFWVLEFFI